MKNNKNLNQNQFEKNIMQKYSYKIINENDLLKNNISNNKNNNSDKILIDENFDEDDDINLNMNINKYLSKKNINTNLSKNNNALLKKNNTEKNRGYLIQNKNRDINPNKNKRNPNFNNKYEQNDIMKEKLLSRIRHHKGGLKNISQKLNNNKNTEIKINPEKLLYKKNEKKENGKNENQESKNVPKILTFLRTFKNFALPLRPKKDKKENEKKNKNNNKNDNINDINQENENKFLVNPNNSCLNFGYKLKPRIKKLNLNKRNLENNQNEMGEGNEGDDYIDYNRFTFRNNGEDEENFNQKRDENKKNKYDNNDNDDDINKIINIDEYNRKNNLYDKKNNGENNINLGDNYIQYYKNKNLELEQLSPNFKKENNKNLLRKRNGKNKGTYFRKKYLKNTYSSPKPQHKNKTNNYSIYTYNNKSKETINIKVQTFDNYNNEDKEMLKSLNIGKRYRKPILNTSFQRNNNINNINKSNSYYCNDISVDEINLSNNYLTTNRPMKNNKIREILVNMNDSLDSINEPNYYTNNNLYSNRSPLKRKAYNTNSKFYYSKKVPLSYKQNGGTNYYSENYDTNQLDEEDDYNKKNSNYARFMEPFQGNGHNNWYNEDSYLSFDIVNMNKFAKNKKLLYRKPLKGVNEKNMNKNNSMYIKRVVHYDNKNYSYFNDSDYISNNNKYKKRLDYTDYDEKEKNIFDFDAPKAVKDINDDSSNNTSEFIYDSSRENQTSINSDINTNKLNVSQSNNSQRSGNNSNIYVKKNSQCISNRGSKKGIYMKKLNTVYNFYKGTKKLFSKINDKVFGNNKNNDNKNNDNKNNDSKNNENKINNNPNNNIIKNNDLLIYPGITTPRMNEENDDNYSSCYSKNSLKIQERKNQNNLKENKPIKEKIINNKNTIKTKYYNFYAQKINGKNNGIHYISKILSYKSYKLPKLSIYFMSKHKMKIYKIPINKNKCYFQKINIINNIGGDNFEHQKICSFFSLGGNININENNNYINKDLKTEENRKIMNLKKNIVNNNQTNSLISNESNNIQNSDIFDKSSFSFKNCNNKLNSNYLELKNNFEINNFNFTLSKKDDKIKFENKKIVPEKNDNLSIINNKENKIYEYDYILSFKNNQFSQNNDLLPQKVIKHFEDLVKETDNLSFIFRPNNKENNLKKKFKNGEIEKIIKKYLTPNKKEEIKNIINKNFLSENKNEEKNLNELSNSESKLKMEWTRKDFSNEIEQAEKYIQELNKKMEENPKKNDIICLLNILTVDNLKIILNKIVDLILKNSEELLSEKYIIENEYILVKIIVDKSITEKRFVNLYAQLCYELYIKLNDKIYNNINFKNILIEECKVKFNLLNNLENDDINRDDEKLFIIKKKFLGNIDFICELVNVDILNQDIGFIYLDELFKKYNSLKENEKFKKELFLEAIVNFLSKFGKKLYEIKDINNAKYLDYFIDNNLNSILKNENLPGFLKYKIINLIEKQKNKWQDSLYEKSILVKGKKSSNKKNNMNKSVNKFNKLRKRKHSNKSNTLKSISPDNIISNKNLIEDNKFNSYKNNQFKNSSNYIPTLNINTNNNNEEIIKLIQKDLENYETFLKQNNIKSKSDLDKNLLIGNVYDWSMIEDILTKNSIDLGELIRCYVEVCIDKISDKSIIFIANDYIKNLICYYSANITNKEKDIIHNKMITLFRNIQDICIDNYKMKEIMGYLLFILIENKLYFIKDFNNFIGMEEDIIVIIAEVIKYAIISSEIKCKKYHNDFKQTKLFVGNSIFNNYVTNEMQNSLNNF